MLSGMQWLDHLTTPDPIWRPYGFDRVTVNGAGGPIFSIIRPCYSEFESGPNLRHLAETAAALLGRGGSFGLHSCRPLGFQYDPRPQHERTELATLERMGLALPTYR